ncbi:TerB family tellurite resistance protein [Paraflavitalea sp. CAU 1676]|uniref:TerB family tellurite resistance protein n=1 Tax=Paraflavitalea sp. CAU 1676 TaxID=3032598 RepID=UPI0023D9BD42|nr:TerB family tellurite resistance protein [Paraflavitalea sp. CAU 1676]MDF2188717.1 TerB family tellurite resistance protein [Paraflavitalea sp. CAU 1676]
MKKFIVIVLISYSMFHAMPVKGQVQELQQLALNIEKLAQFRQMLADMKKGYEILTTGYNAVRNISQGNFQLHKAFLDGLMAVSPAVRQYRRVADIIDYQVQLVKEYKAAFGRFKASALFQPGEIEYLSGVYSRLFNASLENLQDLLTIITASRLRMSDEERLQEIDKIFADMEDKLVFLRDFNSSTGILLLQRQKEKTEVQRMMEIEGLR